MKLLTFFVVIVPIAFFQSCSFEKSQEDFLTQSKWYLHSTLDITQMGAKNKGYTYYKKSDALITLSFFKNGQVRTTTNREDETAIGLWELAEKEKWYLKIESDIVYGDFTLMKLNENELTIIELESDMPTFEYTFMHLSNPLWEDNEVELINKNQQ